MKKPGQTEERTALSLEQREKQIEALKPSKSPWWLYLVSALAYGIIITAINSGGRFVLGALPTVAIFWVVMYLPSAIWKSTNTYRSRLERYEEAREQLYTTRNSAPDRQDRQASGDTAGN